MSAKLFIMSIYEHGASLNAASHSCTNPGKRRAAAEFNALVVPAKMLSRFQRSEDARELIWGATPSNFKPAFARRANGQATVAAPQSTLFLEKMFDSVSVRAI